MRVNPDTEAADQGQTKPRGSGETVRMDTVATILLPQSSLPGWPRSGHRASEGRLNFLCALPASLPPISKAIERRPAPGVAIDRDCVEYPDVREQLLWVSGVRFETPVRQSHRYVTVEVSSRRNEWIRLLPS